MKAVISAYARSPFTFAPHGALRHQRPASSHLKA